MLALIVAIVAVILLLPSCGGNSSKKAGDVESTTLVKAGDKAPDFTFREKTGYSFPMGLDPSQTVYDRYASNYIPRNFVIDRNGKVVLASVGYDPEEFDEMIKTIEKTLE